jgi:hypothetical protein
MFREWVAVMNGANGVGRERPGNPADIAGKYCRAEY